MKKKRGRPKGSVKVRTPPAQGPAPIEIEDNPEGAQGNGINIRHYRLTQHLKKLRDLNLDISKTMPKFSVDAEIAKARAQGLDMALELSRFYIKRGGMDFRREADL